MTPEQVRAVFAGFRPIDLDTSLFEAGFTSKTLVQVLAELRGLGLELDLIDLYRLPTVREAASPSLETRGLRLPWSSR
ncbi:acyl carrier protein [Actinocrispum wychmicini]|uniref:Phosphopantetheine binding protein n=1 Tax=Actinocrispum wychmicini TaxID=1213861 RepID=A0A4V2S5Y6_9PSEU|nr:acyl carrier protein [Actinocrispum wychmicini]TCO54030.1 phosphopantetheine binding protein [Actinocrispum wychmicini]